jgi:hypothetical protein
MDMNEANGDVEGGQTGDVETSVDEGNSSSESARMKTYSRQKLLQSSPSSYFRPNYTSRFSKSCIALFALLVWV